MDEAQVLAWLGALSDLELLYLWSNSEGSHVITIDADTTGLHADVEAMIWLATIELPISLADCLLQRLHRLHDGFVEGGWVNLEAVPTGETGRVLVRVNLQVPDDYGDLLAAGRARDMDSVTRHLMASLATNSAEFQPLSAP